jgi:hypothetical protein
VTFLPIVQRELAVAARRISTYRQRLGIGALATSAVFMLTCFVPLGRASGTRTFYFISFGAFALCVLEALRSTVESVARERREQTLGLLFLTDLRPMDIVLGKFSAASIRSFTVMLCVLPTFSLPILIGGVTGGECARVMLAVLAALLLGLTAGMFSSVIATDGLAALGGASAMLGALMLGPVMLNATWGMSSCRWMAGPLAMLLQSPDSEFASQPSLYWLSTIFSFLLSAALLVGSIHVLKHWPRLHAQRRAESAWQRWLRPGVGFSDSWAGAAARLHNPGVWLAERTLPGRQILWVVMSIGALVCFLGGFFAGRLALPVISVCIIICAFLLKLWVAAVAPQSLNASRRGGALELLLCTPLRPDQIVRGQIDALLAYFLPPALAVSVGLMTAALIGAGMSGNDLALLQGANWILLGPVWMILFVLDLHALAYTGLWYGLTEARVDRAIGKTVFGVLLLPLLTLAVPVAGCLGIIGWPAFWLAWSSQRLKQKFREAAASQFAAETEPTGWWPWPRRKTELKMPSVDPENADTYLTWS